MFLAPEYLANVGLVLLPKKEEPETPEQPPISKHDPELEDKAFRLWVDSFKGRL